MKSTTLSPSIRIIRQHETRSAKSRRVRARFEDEDENWSGDLERLLMNGCSAHRSVEALLQLVGSPHAMTAKF
ncbi:hypothetical protein ABTM68_19745, partial [Acinetobacter baumannii]